MLDRELAHRAAHPLRENFGLAAVDVVQDHRELFAAEAREHVERTRDETLQGLGDATQSLIAGLMPIAVVVGFEVIDIHHQERERTSVLDRLLPQLLGMLVEHAPVLEARQRIVLREVRR